MKITSTLLLLAIALSLTGCRESPQTLAEKYMALMCIHDHLHSALEATETEKEQKKLQNKHHRVNEQLEKLNAKILAKYQGCEKSMHIIREVTANYVCLCH